MVSKVYKYKGWSFQNDCFPIKYNLCIEIDPDDGFHLLRRSLFSHLEGFISSIDTYPGKSTNVIEFIEIDVKFPWHKNEWCYSGEDKLYFSLIRIWARKICKFQEFLLSSSCHKKLVLRLTYANLFYLEIRTITSVMT